MAKIKLGDSVIVTTGKDKGKTGVVKSVSNMRVIVEGINLVTEYVRANPSQEQQGGIFKKEAAMDISNVALLNPTTGKADKVAFKILENENRKVRVFKSTGEVVDNV